MAGFHDQGLWIATLADGPVFISVAKTVPIKGRVRGEFRFEVLNLFNAINFSPVASTSTNATAHEVTGGGAAGLLQYYRNNIGANSMR